MNRNSVRARRICFETHKKVDASGRVYMICSCGCSRSFNPATTPWRADHAARWAEGGQDTPQNLSPILVSCDAGKGGKAAKDTREVAKGKRVKDKHWGIKKSSRPMPGSRRSAFKRKMNGEVVPR